MPNIEETDVRLANLSALVQDHLIGTDAKKGAEIIDEISDDERLSVLLRSHLLREISSDREMDARDAIDDLLAFYSILEVAALCDALPELPKELTDSASQKLSRPAVRRYYEKLYPLLLPQLFLKRLQGSPLVSSADDGVTVLVGFLSLNRLLTDPAVEQFLWFLDDGMTDEYGIADLLNVISDVEKLAKRLLRPLSKQNALDQALQGFVKFSEFCFQFDRLLRTTAAMPFVQSAFWHFHGYWFHQIGGQLFGVISSAIEEYRNCVMPDEQGTRLEDLISAKATYESMDRAQLALQRLTSSIYRAALDKILLQDRGLIDEFEMSPAQAFEDIQKAIADLQQTTEERTAGTSLNA